MVVPNVEFGELPLALFCMVNTQRATARASIALGSDNTIHNDARATWVEYVGATHYYTVAFYRNRKIKIVVEITIVVIGSGIVAQCPCNQFMSPALFDIQFKILPLFSPYVCIYTYINIYIYSYVFIYIYIRMCLCIYAYVNI